MAYTINLTDGTIFAVIADGTINTDSSMTLVGKNYAGYGEFLDENFIHLLENGANSTAPGAPVTGQLWYDTSASLLKVYNGTTFKTLSAATASATQPTSNVAGDLWYDSVNQQLKVYTGTAFILVGPASSAGTGISGPIIETVTDNVGSDHVIVKMYVANTVVAIYSKDATFTPASAISGFATISPGENLSTAVTDATFVGTATNASQIGGVSASVLMRTNTNTSTSGTLSVLNDTGLYVGADSDLRCYVSGTDAYFANQTSNGNIYIRINPAGTGNNIVAINGTSGNATFGSNVSISGQVTLAGIVNSNANGVGNIGSSGGYFNTVFAKSTSAQYADLAERFAADTEYPAGTVVQLGGVNEITRAIDELTDEVFGVISTRAAYLMNGCAGDDKTHPPVAMTGRVPVLVKGTVRKGDRLVSAGMGYARRANSNEITAFNVIGRALEDKLTTEDGTIEAIVTIN